MFCHRLTVRLCHTDETGVLFFGHQFQFAMETLEEFLIQQGMPWRRFMSLPYYFPVVHSEADYLAPLVSGDVLAVTLCVAKVGRSSVTLQYTLARADDLTVVGRVGVVHVLVDKKTRVAVPLSQEMRQIFTLDSP